VFCLATLFGYLISRSVKSAYQSSDHSVHSYRAPAFNSAIVWTTPYTPADVLLTAVLFGVDYTIVGYYCHWWSPLLLLSREPFNPEEEVSKPEEASKKNY
jgi:hypothetical protein